MDSKVKIDDIIKKTIKIYKLAKPTSEKMRNIKYQLRMADIHDHVQKEDVQLALDIILENLQKPRKGILKSAFRKNVNVGFCPRCQGAMKSAKLHNLKVVSYCASCHVAVA